MFKNIFVFSVIIFFSFCLFLNVSLAATCDCGIETDDASKCEDLCNSPALENPLGDEAEDASPQIIIGRVINTVLGIVGSLALLMFVYGGFTWMLAAGNNERVEKGKNILVWATLGLVVIFASYALVEFVIKGLTGPGG